MKKFLPFILLISLFTLENRVFSQLVLSGNIKNIIKYSPPEYSNPSFSLNSFAGTPPTVIVGYQPNYNTYRAYVEWDLSSLVGNIINSASIEVPFLFNADQTKGYQGGSINVYETKTQVPNFSANLETWNALTTDAKKVFTVTVPDNAQWVTFPSITNITNSTGGYFTFSEYISDKISKGATTLYFSIISSSETNSGLVFLKSNLDPFKLVVNYTIPRPATPINFAATNVTSSGCTLSWNPGNLTKVREYHIYQADPNGNIVTYTTTQTSFPISNLNSTTTYLFYVTASNSAGESSRSATVEVVTLPPLPSTPTNLHVLNNSSTSVTLTWDQPLEKVDYYNIYQSIGQSELLIAQSSTNNYVVTGLSTEIHYAFKLSAVNRSGESVKTNYFVLVIPSAPTSFSDHDFPPGHVLMWASSRFATGYKLEQVSPVAQLLSIQTSTSYLVKNPYPGVNIFGVRAFNENCISELVCTGFYYSSTLKSSKVEKSFENIDSNNSEIVVIYPSPVEEFLFVLGLNQFDICIYNLLGQKVFELKDQSKEINLSSLKSGSYIVKISNNSITKTFKILKQ